jgi:hypothetical protein
MSVQITTAMVEMFKNNVYHLSQQKGSRLRMAVEIEQVTGKNKYIDQLGSVSARQRTSRHSDTPRMDTPHSRRRLSLADYDWADLVDDEDLVRTLIDPSSKYAEAAVMAMGRAIDDVIIAAADGTSYTGEAGGTSTAYDTGMTVGIQTVWPGVTAADTGLNVAKLITANRLLGQNDVDADEEKFCIANARQISSLLKDEKLSSHDYNVVKPLVEGTVSKYMGFTIIPCNRIGLDSNSDDKVLFWAKRGIALGVGREINTKIDPRPDKNYATQVFASMTIGATRLEEARVGIILCDPGASPTTDV